MIRGASYTIDLIFNAEYTTTRVTSMILTIGNYDVCSLASGSIVRSGQHFLCSIPSDITAVLPVGERPVTLTMDDTTDGVRKAIIATIPIQNTGSQYENENVSETANMTLELTYMVNNISADLLITDVTALRAIAAANAAKDSEDAAKISEDNAKQSETNAAQSESDSLGYKNTVQGLHDTVVFDAAQVALDRIATGDDAEQTALDRIATGQDAQTATTKAGEASGSAAAALQSKNYASGYADDALASKNASALSAAEALVYRNAAAAIVSGGPKGVYANLAALIAANPDHAYTYLTLDNGYWNYWNGSAFVAGAIYQTALGVAPIVITNKVTNGNFENSTTGFSAANATLLSDNTEYKIGSYALKVTATTAAGSFYKSFTPTANHKYFLGFWTKNGTSVNICIDIYSSGGDYYASKLKSDISGTGWVYKSYEFTPTNTDTIYLRPYIHKTLGATVGDYRWFDGFLLIDLTEAFGAGNEPDTSTFASWVNEFGAGFIDQSPSMPVLNPVLLKSQQAVYAENSAISNMLLNFDSTSNTINVYSKISKTKNSRIQFAKHGPNNLMYLLSWAWYNDSNIKLYSPNEQATLTVIGGGSDNLGPYQVAADANGDGGAIALTGGYHGSGTGGLTPTAVTVSHSVYIDGKKVTVSGDYAGKRADIYVYNKIMGYNTITLGRYILAERVHYSIFDGKIDVEVSITPLEAVTFSLYYGLQLTGSNLFTTIHFVNSDSDTPQSNVDGLTSGVKTTNFIDTVQLSNANVCMDFHVDNGYGLGNRDAVAATYPCFFRSGEKLYANLIRSNLKKAAFANVGWKGSYHFRSL